MVDPNYMTVWFLQSFFAERFFKLFDKDNSGTISLKELMDGLSLLTNGSELDKLNFLFQVYDVDGKKWCLLWWTFNTHEPLIYFNVKHIITLLWHNSR